MRTVALAAILWLAGRVVASAAAPPVILVVMIDGARSDGAGCLDVGRYVHDELARRGELHVVDGFFNELRRYG